EVQIWKERLTPDNVDGILAQFDMVIDATDNFPTRYLINEAAVKQGKPYIYGSIFRFEGYASTFWPAEGGPCYRCMHAEAPPDEPARKHAQGRAVGLVAAPASACCAPSRAAAWRLVWPRFAPGWAAGLRGILGR